MILRGIWFEEGSWQPLEESFANQIESDHMAKFKGLRLEEAPESQKGPKLGKPDKTITLCFISGLIDYESSLLLIGDNIFLYCGAVH